MVIVHELVWQIPIEVLAWAKYPAVIGAFVTVVWVNYVAWKDED